MNAQRRTKISAIIKKLGDIIEEIEGIKDEEQEYLDNMPESLKGGEKGEAAETAVSDLDQAKDYADGAVTQLEGIE